MSLSSIQLDALKEEISFQAFLGVGLIYNNNI